MIRTIVSVEGMAGSMCEAHINDAIRAAFPVRKVTSSRKKKETVILSDESLDRESVKRVIAAAGYTPVSVAEEAYEKRSLFRFGKG